MPLAVAGLSNQVKDFTISISIPTKSSIAKSPWLRSGISFPISFHLFGECIFIARWSEALLKSLNARRSAQWFSDKTRSMYDKAIATTGEENIKIEEATNIEWHAIRGDHSRSMKMKHNLPSRSTRKWSTTRYIHSAIDVRHASLILFSPWDRASSSNAEG